MLKIYKCYFKAMLLKKNIEKGEVSPVSVILGIVIILAVVATISQDFFKPFLNLVKNIFLRGGSNAED